MRYPLGLKLPAKGYRVKGRDGKRDGGRARGREGG